MTKKRFAVLFSGGKDSCLALFRASNKFEIESLLTLIPETKDSFMFHQPDLNLLRKQAEMLDKKLVIGYTKGEKEKELEDLRSIIGSVRERIDGIVIGGIASNYQLERIKKITDDLKLELYAPLLGYTAERLWEDLLDNRFKVILTKIASEGIPKDFLGKIIDEKMLDELRKRSKKYGFRMDFEGGDAESAVLFMPGMEKEIKIKAEITSEDGYRHFLEIQEVR